MLHPAGRRGAAPAVLLLHGFTGSHIETHRLFVKASRSFASLGLASLRFDFLGSGDSEGDFRDTRLGAWIEQAETALGFLGRQAGVDPSRLGVLGLSLGGAAAACLAGRDASVRALALWNAVAEPARLPRAFGYARAVADWRRRGSRDLGGLLLDRGFIDDLERRHPLAEVSAYLGPALVLHGSRDRTVPPSQAAAYRRVLGPRAQGHTVEGADHGFNRVDWEREAIQTTGLWFRGALRGSA